MASSEKTLMTPANIVTIIRILGVPVFVIALLSPWPAWFGAHAALDTAKPWVAVALFVVLALSDSLDGYLARSRGEITTFGKFMDPLADKILVFAALLAMIELDFIPSWVALVILIREFIVSGLRMIAATEGVVIAASWYGKAKTVLQIIAIILFLLKGICVPEYNAPTHPMYIVSWVFMAAALALTVVSLIDYFVKCMPMLGFSGKGSDNQAALKREGAGACACEHEDAGDMEHEDASACADAREVEVRGDIDLLQAAEAEALAAEVISAFSASGKTLCTAESLTGGMIAEALTSVAGSSSVVMGGEVTYAISAKQSVLGVDAALLGAQGAVCAGVVQQMACGARALNGADFCVAVSGIAGPGGAEPGKPVGTVYMCVLGKEYSKVLRFSFSGSRDDIRRKTTTCALNEFLNALAFHL